MADDRARELPFCGTRSRRLRRNPDHDPGRSPLSGPSGKLASLTPPRADRTTLWAALSPGGIPASCFLTTDATQHYCVTVNLRDHPVTTDRFGTEEDARIHATLHLTDLVTRGWSVTRWARDGPDEYFSRRRR